MSKFKKFTLSLIVLGLVTSFVTVGTFASFSAETTNPSNSFSSGTLVLSATKQSGTTCLSTGANGSTDANNNVNSGCDVIMNPSAQKPGDSATVNMTLKNEGSINATTLKLFTSACTAANSSGSYHGAGDPCGILQIYVQLWSDSGFSQAAGCLYGNTATACDFSDPSKTINAFKTAYPSTAGLQIGANNLLTAGTATYVTIGVKLPSSATNAYQGRTASFDFNWLLEQ